MDQDFRLGSKKIYRLLVSRIAVIVFLLLPTVLASTSSEDKSMWVQDLGQRIFEIDAKIPEQLGVYVKDLTSGQEFSLRGNEPWYIASGVKVPIALEVLRQVESGKISLEMAMQLRETDYIDGAGETNSHAVGTELAVRYLMEQMLIYSDNTASDMLIRLAGLDRINEMIRREIHDGFYPITTLADVRRLSLSGFHQDALNLNNSQIRMLKSIGSESKKMETLASMLRLRKEDFRSQSLDEAFAAYYEGRLNSATLVSYGQLLENIFVGRVLTAASRRELLQIMTRVETGKMRIIAGLPSSFVFAHKTGTQHGRVCDFGVAWDKRKNSGKVIIAACVRNAKSLAEAETALKSVGEAVYKSDIFNAGQK